MRLRFWRRDEDDEPVFDWDDMMRPPDGAYMLTQVPKERIPSRADLQTRINELEAMLLERKPWCLNPGDRVRILGFDDFMEGRVAKIQIPGPRRRNEIIQVRVADQGLTWWSLDRVELLHD